MKKLTSVYMWFMWKEMYYA